MSVNNPQGTRLHFTYVFLLDLASKVLRFTWWNGHTLISYCFTSENVNLGAGMIGGGVMCVVTAVLGGPEIISSSKLTMACSCSKSSDGRNVSVVTNGNGSSTTLNGMVVVVGVSAFFKDG